MKHTVTLLFTLFISFPQTTDTLLAGHHLAPNTRLITPLSGIPSTDIQVKLLEGKISAEVFIREVMSRVARKSLTVPKEIARLTEDYRFGYMLHGDFAGGTTVDDNLSIRRLSTDTALLKRALKDPQTVAKAIEVLEMALQQPEIARMSTYEVCEITLAIIRTIVPGDPDHEAKMLVRSVALSLMPEAIHLVEKSSNPLETALTRLSLFGTNFVVSACKIVQKSERSSPQTLFCGSFF